MLTLVRTTPAIVSMSPQFLVPDIEASCAYYRNNLGFQVAFIYGDFYAGVSRDGFTIHLKAVTDPEPGRAYRLKGEHLDVYIGTDDVEGLYREFQARDVEFVQPLHSTEWGTQEFVVRDNSGYILYFGSPA